MPSATEVTLGQEFSYIGSIHLRAEIAFQAEISGLEFWPVFQAEISGLIFPGQNFRPKFFRPEFQAKIPGQNSKPKFRAEIPGQNSKPEYAMLKYYEKSGLL